VRNELNYVLISPVHNEAGFIEGAIRSVIGQTRRPLRWVIVDDGSTDSTAEIVERLTGAHDWIELLRLPRHSDRSFSSKVRSFNAGQERVKHLPYEIIGNLDADLSFDGEYIEFLLQKFTEDPDLGVAGTVFVEDGYSSALNSFEGRNHVAGGCQLFRRECFEQIGGYVQNKRGGVDWIAVTTARMKGWKTRSFREKSFFHHRPLGRAGRGVLASTFAYGQKDYYLGGHPVWELFRVLYRMTRRPYLIDGMALGLGYVSLLGHRQARPVSREFVRFHRTEQMTKLRRILASLLRRQRIDPFSVAAD
jgi:glycosyltransferase involved in cell wall biosynthesis